MNFKMFKLDLEKAEQPETKLPTSVGSLKKQESSIKNICFIDYAKAFDCVDHKKLWNILKEMEIPDHLTCLLRNLYAGQEVTVRTGHGPADWWVKKEVSREMRKYFYSNETTTYQTFWVTVKVHKVQCRSCADVYK